MTTPNISEGIHTKDLLGAHPYFFLFVPFLDHDFSVEHLQFCEAHVNTRHQPFLSFHFTNGQATCHGVHEQQWHTQRSRETRLLLLSSPLVLAEFRVARRALSPCQMLFYCRLKTKHVHLDRARLSEALCLQVPLIELNAIFHVLRVTPDVRQVLGLHSLWKSR